MGYILAFAAFMCVAYIVADKKELARLNARWRWWDWVIAMTLMVFGFWLIFHD